MSIVKINSNPLYTARKVTTLKTVSLLGTVQKYFYFSGTNRDTIPCKCKPQDTVQIRCQMDSTTSGYFFGNMNDGCLFAIRLTSTNVEWYNGLSTAIASKAKNSIDFSIPHTYGFIEGKPIFDNALVDATYTPPTSGAVTSTSGYGIGQAIGSTSKVSSIAIYRFNITSTDGSNHERTTHYYPIDMNGTWRWVDLYSRYSTDSYLGERYDTNATTKTSFSSNEQYGVQLDDLKEITGSGYNDLIAILADDNPRASFANADPAYQIGSRPFAFYLDGTPYGTIQTNKDGELVKGRQPKWSIWNDIIKFGLYIAKDQTTNLYNYKFNLFKDNFGFDIRSAKHVEFFGPTKDILGQFNGYIIHPNYIHAPQLSGSGDMQLHVHNNALCRCDIDDIMFGRSSNTDNNNVFFYNPDTGMSFHAVAGNLIPWLYTSAEVSPSVTPDRSVYKIYGLAVDVQLGGAPLLLAVSKENDFLCKDTDATTKAKYQSVGVDITALTNDAYKFNIIEQLKSDSTPTDDDGNKVLTAVAELKMLKANTTNPSSTDLVGCGDFVSKISTTATCFVDTKINSETDTNYRMIVDEVVKATVGGKEYPIAVAMGRGYKSSDPTSIGTYYVGGSSNNYQHYVYIPFMPVVKTSTGIDAVWTNSSVSVADSETLRDMQYLTLFEVYSSYTDSDGEHFKYGCISKDALTFSQMKDDYGTTATQMVHQWWAQGMQPKAGSSFYEVNYGYYAQRGIGSVLKRSYSGQTADTTIQSYAKFAYLSLDDLGYNNQGSAYKNMSKIDNLSVIAHIYPKSTAPVFCGMAGSWSNEYHCQTTSVKSGIAYYFYNLINCNKVAVGGDYSIYTCLYRYDDSTPDRKSMVYDNQTKPSINVGVKRNGALVATFHCSNMNGGTVNGYTLSIRANTLSGYSFIGPNDEHYNNAVPCFEFTVSSSQNPFTAGDSIEFVIDGYTVS